MTSKGSEKQLLEATNLVKFVSIHFIIKRLLPQIFNLDLMSCDFQSPMQDPQIAKPAEAQ